jgi:hypothetical protein
MTTGARNPTSRNGERESKIMRERKSNPINGDRKHNPKKEKENKERERTHPKTARQILTPSSHTPCSVRSPRWKSVRHCQPFIP